jgi:Protein of unknown function (DUF3435)
MIAFTASRPGALIESGCLRGSNEALCYKDVVLRVLPNPSDPHRHVLAMEVCVSSVHERQKEQVPTVSPFSVCLERRASH